MQGFYVGRELVKQFEESLESARIDFEIWNSDKGGTEYSFPDKDYERAFTIISLLRKHYKGV